MTRHSPPVTINGRLSKPGGADRYQIQVTPGEWLTFRIQARDLGTSKLMAVIAVFDSKGTKLGQAGDEPLAGTSTTSLKSHRGRPESASGAAGYARTDRGGGRLARAAGRLMPTG